MDDASLDEFSQRFAKILFGNFPDWRQYATVEDPKHRDSAMCVNVPCPAAPGDRALWISTGDEEVSVGFDHYHEHFNRYADDDEITSFEQAMSFIRALLEERLVVFSWWSGDRWTGSTTVTPDTASPTPEWAKVADRVRIRSWCGTYDSETTA